MPCAFNGFRTGLVARNNGRLRLLPLFGLSLANLPHEDGSLKSPYDADENGDGTEQPRQSDVTVRRLKEGEADQG